jgi:hypothetical protein
MTTPEVAFAFFDRLLAAIGLIRAKQKEKSERTDQALYALYTALIETKAYVFSLKSGKERDRKKEFAIAELWHDASVPLRKVDRDLAERCFIKGSYWLEPDTWSELRVNRKRIGLNQVLKSVHELLMESH